MGNFKIQTMSKCEYCWNSSVLRCYWKFLLLTRLAFGLHLSSYIGSLPTCINQAQCVWCASLTVVVVVVNSSSSSSSSSLGWQSRHVISQCRSASCRVWNDKRHVTWRTKLERTLPFLVSPSASEALASSVASLNHRRSSSSGRRFQTVEHSAAEHHDVAVTDCM